MSLTWGNTATTPSTPNLQRLITVEAEYCRSFPTPASVQINPGDILLFDATSGEVALSSNVEWDTNLSTTQGEAAPVFLGISMGQKNAADPTNTNILVALKGVAQYPCAALGSAENPGVYVSWAAQGTNNLADQQVAVTATLANSIGTVIEVEPNGGTVLTFAFKSNLIFGANNAA